MDDDLGKRYGKPDIERLGLFSEMGYMNGKGYAPIQRRPPFLKGYNFVTCGRKYKNGTGHGYFDEEFKRVFIGEAIVRKPKKKGPAPPPIPFIVNSVPKKHSTPGDIYGTFSKEMPAFSAKLKPKPKYVSEPANFLWRSGKIGGPGYADTGIDKYPPHLPDPYGRKLKSKEYGKILGSPLVTAIYPKAYFDEHGPYREKNAPTAGLYLDRYKKKQFKNLVPWIPNGRPKWPGGSHAGCFDRFPAFMPCKYIPMVDANKPRGSGKLKTAAFVPIPMIPKSQQVTPTLDMTVDRFMNATNAQTFTPSYIKNLQVPLF